MKVELSKETKFGLSGVLFVLLCVALMAAAGAFVKVPAKSNNKPLPIREVIGDQEFPHELCRQTITPEESGKRLCTVRLEKVVVRDSVGRTTGIYTALTEEREPCGP